MTVLDRSLVDPKKCELICHCEEKEHNINYKQEKFDLIDINEDGMPKKPEYRPNIMPKNQKKFENNQFKK
ncbi:hypothetical protein BpHYR1_018263 [Brachionus plicatilis]|uniref:Uncharacterized protein n=1 Tax=Brachionus plicatilis TaxID=10195 RepID=A0A3M7Q2I4_BRAPC|nr:hypothetical protein BpHYR1_018263 [Brachionus plicatilis]